jgi:hypothetical protein
MPFLLVAAGLVSLPWALCHLPLFGISPSNRAMPLMGFVGFAANIWVASVIFAWLLWAGRGSLLVVVVFRAWFDIVTTSPLGPPALPTMMGALITLLGLTLLCSMLRQPAARVVGRQPSSGTGATGLRLTAASERGVPGKPARQRGQG